MSLLQGIEVGANRCRTVLRRTDGRHDGVNLVPHSSTTNRQVGARAPSIAETPITQVDLRPTSTDSESTPQNPKNPVRNRVVFDLTRTSPPANARFRQGKTP